MAVVPGARRAEYEAAAVALLAMALLIGSFPDGLVERRWQRLALRCSWVILLVRRWLCLLHLSCPCT